MLQQSSHQQEKAAARHSPCSPSCPGATTNAAALPRSTRPPHPLMHSTTAMPCAEAACASMYLPLASPMQYRWGTTLPLLSSTWAG